MKLLRILERKFSEQLDIDFQRLYYQAIMKSMQLCWDLKLAKEAQALAARALDQFVVYLIALKLESKVRPNLKHEPLLVDCIKHFCVVSGYWLPLLNLEMETITHIPEAAKIVRELIRSLLPLDDNFRSMVEPLLLLSAKVERIQNEKRQFEELLLRKFKDHPATLEVHQEVDKTKNHKEFAEASQILMTAKSCFHLLNDDLYDEEKNERRPQSSVSLIPQTEKDMPSVEGSKMLSPKKVDSKLHKVELTQEEKSASDLKFYLQSFIKVGKKSGQKKTKDETSFNTKTNNTLATDHVENMDGFFTKKVGKSVPSAQSRTEYDLQVYNHTFAREKKFWVSKLRTRNITVNIPLMKSKLENLDQIIESEYSHLNGLLYDEKMMKGKRSKSQDASTMNSEYLQDSTPYRDSLRRGGMRRTNTEIEMSTKDNLLHKAVKRHQSVLRLRNFFTIKAQSEDNRTTEDARFLQDLEEKAAIHTWKAKQTSDKYNYDLTTHFIRSDLARSKLDDKKMSKSHSLIVKKMKNLTESPKPVISKGFKKENTMGKKISDSSLAKSMVALYRIPYQQRVLMKISKNLMFAARLQEEKRIGFLTTNISEIEESRNPSHSKNSAPNFSNLLGSMVKE